MTEARTREERIARQEHDDGDPDDSVVYRKAHSRGARGIAYHDDPECPRILHPEKYTDGTRREAQLRWLGPCQVCSLGKFTANGTPVEDGGD